MHPIVEDWSREHVVTMNVIRSLPESASGERPHDRAKSGGELCWHLAEAERWFVDEGLGVPNLGDNPVPRDTPPESLAAMAEAFEASHASNMEAVSSMEDTWYAETVDFFGSEVPRAAILAMMVKHEIHHRGQLSVYLRLAGARVPSIYGPSADEDWNPPV